MRTKVNDINVYKGYTINKNGVCKLNYSNSILSSGSSLFTQRLLAHTSEIIVFNI